MQSNGNSSNAGEPTVTRSEILGEVWLERARQLKELGRQSRPSGTSVGFRGSAKRYMELCALMEQQGGASWFAIIIQRVYEAASEEEVAALRAELIRVAAWVVAWVENLDNGVA
jgi:hypothetical protein